MPTGWVSLGDNNQVFQGTGTQASLVMKPEARWPNAGSIFPWQDSTINPSPDWLYVDSAGYDANGQNGWLTDAGLPSQTRHVNGYWVGARVHIMSGDGWYMYNPLVTNYTASTKTLVTDDPNGPDANGNPGAVTIKAGNEYYLTGKKGEMDSPGEWFYDTATSRLCFYSNSTPTNVQIKTRPYGFNISGAAFINLKKLGFFACTIKSDVASTDCTFDGLKMQYPSHSRVKDWTNQGIFLRSRSVLRNSELAYAVNGMVVIHGSDVRIINNNIHDCGYIPIGVGAITTIGYGADSTYSAYRSLISHNTIRSVGHAAIGGPGRDAIVQYNDFYDGMKMSTDGALLYWAQDSGKSVIHHNLIHDVKGPVNHTGAPAMGFYVDNQNSGWLVHHNVIWNISGRAMHNNARNNFDMIFNNTFWNCGGGYVPGASVQSHFVGDGPTGTKYFNNLFNGIPTGTQDTWDNTDVRYNLTTDPLFVAPTTRNFQLQATSPGINTGIVIPGVTDGFSGSAPDLGALESGLTDWTASAGYKTTPPSPDPVYSAPYVPYANQVKDGSFETGSLSPNWTVAGIGGPANVGLICSSAWYDPHLRSAYHGLQFGGGGSEVSQVVTGLQSDRRYKFYCGVQKTDPNSVVTVGVRAYGYPDMEVTVPTTGVWQQYVLTTPMMVEVPFITGPAATTATVYVRVTRPANSPVAPKNTDGSFPTVAGSWVYLGNYNNTDLVNPYYPSTGVYVDDLAVLRSESLPVTAQKSPLVQYAMNQTSGISVTDAGSGDRTATMVGTTAPLWQAGVTGNALGFDGVDDYLLTPAIASPTTLTVSCWAKSNTATWNAWACFASQRPSFTFGPEQGNKNIALSIYSDATTQNYLVWTPPANFDITVWHHYAAVFDPATQLRAIYVDGALVTSQYSPFSMNPDTGSVYIGVDDYYVGEPWVTNRNLAGVLDDVRVYDRALSPAELDDLAGGDAGLILHLAMDESAGATKAWDSSINGSSGTLTNMTPATAWGSGLLNGALTFDGVDDHVLTPAITTPTTLTVACWAKSTTSTWNAWDCLVSQQGPNANKGFFLGPNAGTRDNNFVIYDSVNNQQVRLTWNAPAGFDITVWHHYAGVFSPDTQQMTFYVDGVLSATRSAAVSIATYAGPVYVGRADYWWDNVRNFNGKLDDVRVYSRALSWWELLQLSDQTNMPPYN